MAIDEYKKLGNYGLHRKPEYSDYHKKSQYILMKDDVKIAADILLPIGLKHEMRLPSLLYQTRYWRALEPKKILSKLMKHAEDQGGAVLKFLVSHGYAIVMVDARGSGASYGNRISELAMAELHDSKDIIEWIIHQPWSNGKIATFGNSYAGSTSELSVISQHPALKVISPRANEWDVYTDILCPGGIPNYKFIQKWAENNHLGDSNDTSRFGIMGKLIHGVLPVSNDSDRTQLKEAVKQHEQNADLLHFYDDYTFKDDPFNALGEAITQSSPFSYQHLFKKTQLPIQSWGSWMDACTADVVIRRFLSVDSIHQGIIGSWSHSGRTNGDPLDGLKFNKKSPSKALSYPQQMMEWIRAFDYYTKDMKTNGWQEEQRLQYITMGENCWKSTTSWPPSGTKINRFYLAENKHLSTKNSSQDVSDDHYRVDFSATTGTNSRWQTQMGNPVFYPDRRKQDKKLLTYTSDPLEESLELTGYPLIHLLLSTDHTDGAVFVYLELVSPDDSVIYLTEGQLRFIHRKISPTNEAPYTMPYPYHSFLRKDSMDVIPGESMEIIFHLQPISIRIPQHYRLRVAIAGHDEDNFSRNPQKGNPTMTISRGGDISSFIELPIIEQNKK